MNPLRLSLGLAVGFFAITASAAPPIWLLGSRAVVQLHVEDGHPTERVATGVLVHRDDTPGGVVLYFLTSHCVLPASAARGGEAAERGPCSDSNQGTGIAVLRIVAERSPLVPAAVVLDPPQPGTLFAIVAHTASGVRVVVPQRVQTVSGRWATGDTTMSWAGGCVGSPAFTATGVFGLINRCETGEPPTIELLSSARGLLRRLIPGLDLGSDGSQRYGIGE